MLKKTRRIKAFNQTGTLIDALAFGNAHFGAGSGDIFLDNVGCTGSESSLLDCNPDTSVSCYYGHSEDAGVRCEGNTIICTQGYEDM